MLLGFNAGVLFSRKSNGVPTRVAAMIKINLSTGYKRNTPVQIPAYAFAGIELVN